MSSDRHATLCPSGTVIVRQQVTIKLSVGSAKKCKRRSAGVFFRFGPAASEKLSAGLGANLDIFNRRIR
jgi:hypothetical protein